jgi:hypothetical protein
MQNYVLEIWRHVSCLLLNKLVCIKELSYSALSFNQLDLVNLM